MYDKNRYHEKIICECGGKTNKKDRKRHMMSAKHKKYIENTMEGKLCKMRATLHEIRRRIELRKNNFLQ